MSIQSYRDLEAWQLGMEFAVGVYGLTKHFPREELYGLTSQVRRSAVSVPSNISEGHPQSTKTYLRFVGMALGSLAEAETQIELARRLRFAGNEELDSITQVAGDLRRVLFGLRRSLLKRAPGP